MLLGELWELPYGLARSHGAKCDGDEAKALGKEMHLGEFWELPYDLAREPWREERWR